MLTNLTVLAQRRLKIKALHRPVVPMAGILRFHKVNTADDRQAGFGILHGDPRIKSVIANPETLNRLLAPIVDFCESGNVSLTLNNLVCAAAATACGYS